MTRIYLGKKQDLRPKKQHKLRAKIKKASEVFRAADGKLLSGSVLNPAGRSKGTSHIEEFKLAMKEVEKEKRKSLMIHFCERAFVSDRVLCVWVDRVLPALKAIQTQDVPGDAISDEEAKRWREEMKRRFT